MSSSSERIYMRPRIPCPETVVSTARATIHALNEFGEMNRHYQELELLVAESANEYINRGNARFEISIQLYDDQPAMWCEFERFCLNPDGKWAVEFNAYGKAYTCSISGINVTGAREAQRSFSPV